jgi:hypothetical protein
MHTAQSDKRSARSKTALARAKRAKQRKRRGNSSGKRSARNKTRAAYLSGASLGLLLLVTAAGSVFLAFYLTRQMDFLVVREILITNSAAAPSDASGAANAASGSRAMIALALPGGGEMTFPLAAGNTCDRDCRIELAPGVRAIFSILGHGRLYAESSLDARTRVRVFAHKKDWWRLDEGRAWLIGSDDSVGDDRELARLRFDLESDRETIKAGGLLVLRLRTHNPEHVARIGGALGDAPLLFVPVDAPNDISISENADPAEISAALLAVPAVTTNIATLMLAYAGVDCALTNADQRLAIWSFGHKGSWYMRSWRVPLEGFAPDPAGRSLLARSARPYPRSVYPPVPRDWWQRWIIKRDTIMEASKSGKDWQRLEAVYTNAAPLGSDFTDEERGLREPLRIPIARYDMVSSPYGVVRTLTVANGSWHRGVDFAAPPIAEARAPWPGMVVFADTTITSGNMVVVHHGFGIYSSFMHLSAFRAKPSARLRTGDIVGLVGTTGLSTGPHLHYELRAGNCAIDPTPYFVRSPFAREPAWKMLQE